MTAFLDELHRPCGPGPVQFVSRSAFVVEAIEAGARRVLGRDLHHQHSLALAIGIVAPLPAEDPFTVLPFDVEAAIPHKRSGSTCWERFWSAARKRRLRRALLK
jgi:hypothetical protein